MDVSNILYMDSMFFNSKFNQGLETLVYDFEKQKLKL